jgi:activator of HSP90 ATPase
MMRIQEKTPLSAAAVSRRRVVETCVLVMSSLLARSVYAQGNSKSNIAEPTSKGAERMLTSLHQEIDFKGSPQRIYAALLDSKQFSSFSGEPAQIDRSEGGAFSMFGGKIVGRNVELITNQRIVQAWRPASWDPGVYSVVKFELAARGADSRVLLDHTGFPQGEYAHLNPGWKLRYWDPLQRFLA